MLSRILVFIFLIYPLLSFSQKDINLNDLELEDIEVPSLSDLEILERDLSPKFYAPSNEIVFEEKGGIHEKLPKPNYLEKSKTLEEEITWRENILPSKNEPYYLYFSMGYGNISYTGSLPTTNNPALDFDLLGIYWPKFNRNFMVGMVLGLTMDELNIGESSTIVSQPTASLSMNYFLGQNIGSGVFARLDLGFGMVATLADEPDAYILDYKLGGSMLIGTGYAFALSQENRLLINLSYKKMLQTFNNSFNGSDAYILSGGLLF